MRVSVLLVGCLLLGTASAQVGPALGAVAGSFTALGKTMTAFLPPVGAVPLVLGLKALAILKFKKVALLAAPILAPIALAKAKMKFIAFKVDLAKSALHAAGQTTASAIELPLKLTAVKMGALTGAIAGAKGGLASYRSQPRTSLFKAFTIPIASLISGLESRIPKIPMKHFTLNFKKDSGPAYQPEPDAEADAPLYGRKPTTTTPRPLPSYIPEPPRPSY